MVLAYPVPSNETAEIVANDAFMEALRDWVLSLKVRELEQKTLDEGCSTALRLNAYHRTSESIEARRRPLNASAGPQRLTLRANSILNNQLDRFLATQREEQRRCQRMEERIDRQFED